MKRTHQNGNVLFMILIAIFLLGALTALMARTGMNTEETGDTEKTSIRASEIMRYTAGMQQAVSKLLLNGCSENDISFWSSKWDTPADYDNTNNPEGQTDTNYGCFVFDVRGAGYPFLEIPDGTTYTQYLIHGTTEFMDVGDSDTPDLIIQAAGLSEEMCRQINRTLNVQSFNEDGMNSNDAFTGSYPSSGGRVGDDNVHPEYVAGKKAACMKSISWGGYPDDTYIFYQVLIAR